VLWYGYIYYITFNIWLITFLVLYLRLYLTYFIFNHTIYLYLSQVFIGFTFFFYLTSFWILNSLLDLYTNLSFLVLPLHQKTSISLFITSYAPYSLYPTNSLALNLLEVYSYPFIYVFLLVTVLSIIYCLSYNQDELISFMFYCQLILFAGYILFYTDSIILFFFSYEILLIPSFFILYKFAKTRRCVEAAYLMFFWTQFGALFLIFAFIYIFIIANTSQFSLLALVFFSPYEVNFLFVLLLTGFGVKLPIWPFYGWLPKAHVEASTNFSIFLSGVLVKFAFFGFLKCLLSLQLDVTYIYIFPFLTLGLVDAVFKLFYQIDLKKLVAYSTVIEMHWLTICVVSGNSNLLLASFCMLISHALLSTNSFLLVDAIARRFKTRLITEITSVNFLTPKLFLAILLNSLIFLGFPGSIFFIAEFLFFSFLIDLFPLLAIMLLLFLYLIGPTFFFRSWLNTMFGFSKALTRTLPADLSTREFILFFGMSSLMYWLGISWQALIY